MSIQKPKSKFKLGQKVWYFADGYVTSDRVQAIFLTSDGEEINVALTETTFKYETEGSKYFIKSELVFNQDSVYATKEQLIDYIKKEVNEED